MSSVLRRTVTVSLAAATLILATPVLGLGTAHAAPAPAGLRGATASGATVSQLTAGRQAAAAAAAAALPSYQTWISDVTAVTGQASAYLATRLPDRSVKAAIVLDIDNTALESHYSGGITTPATKPVLAVARQAAAAGAAVIFVTARPELIRLATKSNLTSVGYPVDGLYMRPFFDFSSDLTLKTNARIAIEKAGYTIVANIGNNPWDVEGGHAERTFKLPDYDGQLS